MENGIKGSIIGIRVAGKAGRKEIQRVDGEEANRYRGSEEGKETEENEEERKRRGGKRV